MCAMRIVKSRHIFFRMDLVYLVFVIARVFADTTVELSTGNYRFSVKVLLEYILYIENLAVKTSFNIFSNS